MITDWHQPTAPGRRGRWAPVARFNATVPPLGAGRATTSRSETRWRLGEERPIAPGVVGPQGLAGGQVEALHHHVGTRGKTRRRRGQAAAGCARRPRGLSPVPGAPVGQAILRHARAAGAGQRLGSHAYMLPASRQTAVPVGDAEPGGHGARQIDGRRRVGATNRRVPAGPSPRTALPPEPGRSSSRSCWTARGREHAGQSPGPRHRGIADRQQHLGAAGTRIEQVRGQTAPARGSRDR